ncbi:energy transducer TonB [Fluviicola sp.]|uniref:energy transducer TonB n=1 Tax=Fluviicola sp. TaxID=1917219 RepID=UPI002632B014|nr:energy transducer TonB [Fluviicola sp.]
MKLFILFLLFLFSAASIFAQSKKKINDQLNTELAAVKTKVDSITVLVSQKASQLLIKQQDFESAQLRNTQRQATDLKDALKSVEKSYNQLIRLEKDPAKLVNLNALKAEIDRFQEKQSATELPKEIMEPKELILIKDTILEKKRSRKAQNEWLRGELVRYSLVIEENRTKLNQINNYSATIDRMRPELDSVYLSYEEVLYNLAIGEANLRDSIHKLREFSLKNWPKNFSPVFEREFGKPERNEISQPTGEGWSTNVWYAYNEPVELAVDFIRYANSIPINEFSVERMKSQGSVIRRFDPDPAMIYSHVDEEAEFPGGRSALMKFLAENFQVPEVLKEMGMSFKLRMKFVVLEDGTLSDVTVYKGMPGCPECDREAIRVFKIMPKWIPAKLHGKTVKSQYNLPINIHLN